MMTIYIQSTKDHEIINCFSGPSLGTLKVKRLDTQVIQKSLGASKHDSKNWQRLPMPEGDLSFNKTNNKYPNS